MYLHFVLHKHLMEGINILFVGMKYFKKFNLIFVKMTISHKMFSLSLKYCLMLVEQSLKQLLNKTTCNQIWPRQTKYYLVMNICNRIYRTEIMFDFR